MKFYKAGKHHKDKSAADERGYVYMGGGK